MAPSIVPVYTAILAMGYIYLAVRVIRVRRVERIAIGTGGNPRVERAMRAHANCAEYAPLGLLLLAFAELLGSPAWLIHLLAATLVAARAVHAYGISQEPEDYRLRTLGMAATFGVLGMTSLVILLSTLLRA
jgi:uncharacterized membrane protein YecN with MAPEG domain